jgi:SPP1 gp7 family putative phage head morphogenesis protein
MEWLRKFFDSTRPDRPTSVVRNAIQTNITDIGIHQGLKKEMSGPAGNNIRHLLIASCKQTSLTEGIPVNVIELIHAESLRGTRAKQIAEDLRVLLPGMTIVQLKSIALTVIGKAHTARDRTRSEHLGIKWYVWETSGDERVRKSHRKMQGVIVPWSDPPCPEQLIGEDETFGVYHAGESVECRCVCLPLVAASEVSWPHRVYYNRQIRRMKRTEFKQISGLDG